MIFKVIFILSIAGLASSAPASRSPTHEARASAPSVVTSYGTWVGSTSDSIDYFLGIPFAEPPTGSLRFMAPVAPTTNYGVYDATEYGASCPQMVSIFADQSLLGDFLQDVLDYIDELPILEDIPITDQSEDCLFLNVVRPTGIAADAALPVMFWIFGGGFTLGGTSYYPGEALVSRSVEMGTPIVYVSVNYRVNAFGFLPGTETVANGGNINAGLLDQRLGMQWVNEYISLFGGDPTKVTIFGESAGAISVGYHLIANNGDNDGLFRAAIMESGSAIPTLGASGGENEYQALVNAAGCADASNTFTCLQELSYDDLLDAVNTLPFILSYSGLHLPFMPRVDGTFITEQAQDLIAAGKFAKVPIITGDQYDEGTLLTLGTLNITTDEEVDDYLAFVFPGANETIRQGILEYYPEDVLDGSPFDTGLLNVITPENKRVSAIMGDIIFQTPRRVTLSYMSKVVPAWSYACRALMDVPILGSFHGSDLLFLYGYDSSTPSTEFQERWISFAVNLNPNPTSGGYIDWPTWNISQQLLEFTDSTTSLITDDYRIDGTDFLTANIGTFAF